MEVRPIRSRNTTLHHPRLGSLQIRYANLKGTIPGQQLIMARPHSRTTPSPPLCELPQNGQSVDRWRSVIYHNLPNFSALTVISASLSSAPLERDRTMSLSVFPSTVTFFPRTTALFPEGRTVPTFTDGGFPGWSDLKLLCSRRTRCLVSRPPEPSHCALVFGRGSEPSLLGPVINRQACLE